MSLSLPYLLLMLLLTVLALTQDRLSASLRERMWMPCFLLLAVFFGLRGYVGDDWLGYYPVYEFVQPGDFHFNIFGHHTFRYEPAFAILAYVCRIVAGPGGFLFFQCVVTLLQLWLLFRFLRRQTDNLPFSLVIFLAMGGLIMLINTMRNTLALFIFLNALPYLQQRRAKPYFLLCLAAMMFHLSSVLFIPLYFVLHRRINKWVFLVVFAVSYLIVLLRIPVLSAGIGFVASLVGGKLAFMVQAYLEDANMSRLSFALSIGSLERLATGVVVFFCWDKLLAMRKENVIYINALLLFFFFYFAFSEVREVGRRLSELFIYCYWVIWPDLLKCFTRRFLRLGYVAFLCAYCSLKVVGTVGYPNTRYENVLTGHTHYNLRRIQHLDDMEAVRKSQGK